MDGRLTGKILWFSQIKGYGEIGDESGNRAFFTQSDCDGCLPGLFAVGQVITFALEGERLFGKARASEISLPSKKTKSRSPRVRRNEIGV